MRKLPSWIDSFFESTADLPSPPLFRKWAGLMIIAGTLERKVWVTTRISKLYPNLYLFLTAPPGVGKSVLTSRIYEFWKSLETHHVASSSVTKAAMMDELDAAKRDIVRPGSNPPVDSFNSLLIACNELGSFLPEYANDFMNTLTDIYDGHPFSERRRSSNIEIQMASPQINLVAGTTPSYLNNFIPDGAWEQGFLSRVILLFSGETILQPLLGTNTHEPILEQDLRTDLKHISELYGQMTFTDEAAAAFTKWHMAGGPPRPDHPKLFNYCVRRSSHLLKMCMSFSASERDDLLITIDHYERALNWLVEAETFMPDVFKSMKSGGDSSAIEATWHYAYEYWIRKKEPIPETQLVNFIQERVPVHAVERVLKVMVKGGALIAQIGAKGQMSYKPAPKSQR